MICRAGGVENGFLFNYEKRSHAQFYKLLAMNEKLIYFEDGSVALGQKITCL